MNPFRLKSLTLLMIISQILLTAFVVQWLISQYNNEKSELKNQLAMQFDKSEQEVLDSLLEINLINPILKNKNGFKISTINEDIIDTTHGNGKVKMFINKTEKNDSIELVTVVNDTLHAENNFPHSHLTDSTRDLLLHGVRLIVKEVTGGGRHKQTFEQELYSEPDTILLKNILTTHLKGKDYDFHSKLIKATPGDSSNHTKKFFYLESSTFPGKYGLEILNYRFYLFKKVFPQALFALILLLLTGFAFIISHRLLKRQARLNTMKNDFIDNISHELKTPLSTVKVVIEALQDENLRKDEKMMKEYLEMAASEIGRLELLTGKVLNTSMMESGTIILNKQRVDLKKLISGLIDTMKVRLNNEDAHVTIDSDDKDFFIEGDSFHIQGALLNLIDNSLKYSGNSPLINIQLNKINSGVEIKIKDNGPGIPEEYLKKVFDKFFRVPSGNLHNVKGHGLGLSYVDMVMKMHNGKVSVENDLNGGCVFTLFFPFN